MTGYSREECRRLDRTAIDGVGIPGILLMEHASLGAADWALELLDARGGHRGAPVWILCGPGNNGGDGYAMARHLHNAGANPRVWELVDGDRVDPRSDAGINRMIARTMEIPLMVAHDALPPADPPAALIVDALFGTGLTRALEGRFAGAIDRVGLVTAEHATVRNIRQAYRHYRYTPDSPACKAFKAAYCVPDVCIEMVGVWDTVKALGL